MFTFRHTRKDSSSSEDTTRVLKKVSKKQKLRAEKIVGKRFRDGQVQLQVKWRGFNLSMCTWEYYKNMGNYVPLITQYEAETLSRSKKKVFLLDSGNEPGDDEIESTFSGYSPNSSPRTPPMLNESCSDGTWSVDSSLNFSPIFSQNSSPISTDSSISSVPRKNKMKVDSSGDDEGERSDGTWSEDSSRIFSGNSSPISTDSSISSVPRKKKMKVDSSGDDENERNPKTDESTDDDDFYSSDSSNFFSLLQAKARLEKKLKIDGDSSDSS